MPSTFKQYSVWEAGLRVFSSSPVTGIGGRERAQEADIIATRRQRSTNTLGPAEIRHFVWLLITGLDDNDMARLTDMLFGDVIPGPGNVVGDRVRYEKRRYCIPFNRLSAMFPWADFARVRDPDVVYQPFMLVDQDNADEVEGRIDFLTSLRPVDVHGLVYDKAATRFL